MGEESADLRVLLGGTNQKFGGNEIADGVLDRAGAGGVVLVGEDRGAAAEGTLPAVVDHHLDAARRQHDDLHQALLDDVEVAGGRVVLVEDVYVSGKLPGFSRALELGKNIVGKSVEWFGVAQRFDQSHMAHHPLQANRRCR